MTEKPGLLEPEEYETQYTLVDFDQPQPPSKFEVGVEALIGRMGAKSQLRTWLVQNFPPCYAYVEPFGGSFKVLLWKPRRDKVEVINDVDNDMVHLFRYCVHDPEGFAAAVNRLPTHEAIIMGYRDALARRALKGIERAVACYYSLVGSFNDQGTSYFSNVYQQSSVRVDERRVRAFAKRLRGVDIRCTDFNRIIDMANKQLDPKVYAPGKVFFYLDPPYWGTAGYRTHQGVSSFGWSQQVKLAERCWEIHQAGNLFIETNSDHDDLKKLYGGYKLADGSPAFYVERREVYYSVGGSVEARSERGEFIISNFPLQTERERNQVQRGLFS